MDQIQFNYELTNEEKMIYDILQAHKGREAAILGPTISSMTGIPYDQTRSIISHLINQHGYLIASYSRGYFMPLTSSEINDATKSLRHRALSILYRASRLQKISLVDIFNQTVMEFKDELK